MAHSLVSLALSQVRYCLCSRFPEANIEVGDVDVEGTGRANELVCGMTSHLTAFALMAQPTTRSDTTLVSTSFVIAPAPPVCD
jgi:hypothetical protein